VSVATGTYRVTNETRGAVLASQSGLADSFVRRGLGLMGRKSLSEGGGLVIRPCNGVVSFFMRFPIDVVFVDRDGRVCHLLNNLAPWKASRIVRSSKLVVELPEGTIDRTGTKVGDSIRIEPA
jgi:uncharacterized membrane protein (UPF0127 family)